MTTYLITATPPTPNGDLHVGHLSGPFLAADVFARFQRMRGARAVFATGSDDHQSYVLTAAERQGEDPVELADAYAEQIQATLKAADIRVDRFVRALGNPAYLELVRGFFGELVDRRLVVRKRHHALYCDLCQRPLFEGFVRGWCPRCGEETPGHLCEICGWVNDPVNLVEPVCSLCLGAPRTVEREGLFLPLEPHRQRLEDFWATRTSWRPHLLAFCEAMLARRLPDYPVSYPGNWGVPTSVPGWGGEVINVWLEMYAGHAYAARTIPGLGRSSEPIDLALVQFLGHDNSFYNAVLHPAVALSLGGDWPLPEHVITNEFYFLEERKFSTSRNHTVPGREAVAMAGPDCLRFHLARTNPERWQTDFSPAALTETDQGEVCGAWAAAIEDLLRLTTRPAAVPQPGPSDLRLVGLVEGARKDLERSYGLGGFSLRQASSTLLELVIAAGDFARRALRAEPGPVAVSRSADAAFLLGSLALFSAPLMPGLSQTIWEELGSEDEVTDAAWPHPCGTLRAPERMPHASESAVRL